uniref:Coat protein n=1 Tax=Leviviridae sp. TaxID=2027243 RepID=A0A514D263_9VIRU|nr:MAG: hypothetical protein H4BulkL24436e10201_000002 [Leviviridae sp.]QDH91521.1 MAG: hypothetical protein H2Rhizo31243e3675_000002 [Leviviridae sp.]
MSAIAAVKLSGILDHSLARLTTSATVGVDTTLNPEGINPNGISAWVDRSGGIAIGYPRLTMSVRPPTKASRIYKIQAKLVLPTLEQTSASTMTGIQPAPTKAYDCTCVMEFFLPERSTLAERQKLFSQVASLFARTVNANDGVPTDATGSPLENAVTTYETVY